MGQGMRPELLSEAWWLGYMQCNDGYGIDENPFVDALDRLEWFRGYVECRTENRIGHILEKYGEIL